MAGAVSTKTTTCVGDDNKFQQVGDFNLELLLPKIIVTDIETCIVLIHVIDGAILTVEGI